MDRSHTVMDKELGIHYIVPFQIQEPLKIRSRRQASKFNPILV